MLKFVEEFQRDDSEDDQASREEPNVCLLYTSDVYKRQGKGHRTARNTG